jgi:5-methyltetrahydropteroyltriglutamate--homocysteine methyltransferase
MKRTTPPFRADMVGSLLRPAAIKEARARHATNELDAAGLRQIEDREIETIVRRQEAIGLQAVTDGEFRRSWWHFDFFRELVGCELREAEHGIQFHGIQTKAQTIAVTGKIDFPSAHPMLAHFNFLKRIARATPT